MASSVKDVDKGFRRVVASIHNAKVPKTLTIGIHEDAGGAYPGGQSVAEIAERNEFGLGPPARPFIGGWVEENEDRIEANLEKVGELICNGQDAATSLERLGLLYVGQIQARISSGIAPPNAPATIARKGSSTPLVDTGQLRSSIRSKVE